ncbi:MAG: tetratricopeptide repeat protein [Acidobacteria bacterium]|nr:tetratricopeptide repeat protein [Acidobacteriota bacterium]
MADVFIRLLAAYKRHGFKVRTGLNPLYFGDADAPFARLFDAAKRPVSVGAGLAPQEIHLLEALLAVKPPARALVIGNAFGWSSIAVGLSAPGATVVAMEAGFEGEATRRGTALTHTIAAEEGLSVRVVEAMSPRDTAAVVHEAFEGQPVDFVLIDGLHVNEQLRRDIDGVLPFASPECIFFLHDVLSWHMLAAFSSAPFGVARERRILTRCPSGPGLVFPATIAPEARTIIDAFSDDTIDLPELHAALGATDEVPGPALEERLAAGWKYRHIGMAGTWAAEGDSGRECDELRQAAEERPDDPEAHLAIGAYYADQGRWMHAEPFLRRAVDLAPEWAPALQQSGRVLRELGADEEAEAVLLRAEALAPEWAAPLVERALILEKRRRLVDAYALMTRASAMEPAWEAASELCGRAAFNLGAELADRARWSDAEDLLREAMRRCPTWAMPPQQLGRVLRERGALDEARRILHAAMELEPGWAATPFELGHVALAEQRHGEALRWFGRAMELAPDWTPALVAFGRCAFDTGDYPTAIDALRQALDRGAVHDGVAHLLALATERHEGATAATPVIQLAVAVAPESPEAHFDLARMRAAGGDEAEALRHFLIAGRLRPEWAAPWTEAFALALRIGAAADADGVAQQLAALGEDSVASWLAVAYMNARAGAGEAARQAALRALALRPEPMEPLKALAERLIAAGDLTAAERLCREVLERFPQWAGLHFVRGEALERLHRFDDARLVFEHVLALRPSWEAPRAALTRVSDAIAMKKAS